MCKCADVQMCRLSGSECKESQNFCEFIICTSAHLHICTLLYYPIFARQPFNRLKLRAITRLYNGRVNQVSAAGMESVHHLPNVPLNHVFTREEETGVYQVNIMY